jgi:hypothetical protein
MESCATIRAEDATNPTRLYRLMSEIPLDPSTEAFERVSREGLAPILQIYQGTV